VARRGTWSRRICWRAARSQSWQRPTRDLDGRVSEVQFDLVFPELLAALDNTPGGTGRALLARFLSGIEPLEADFRDPDANDYEHRADNRCDDRVSKEHLVRSSGLAVTCPLRSVAECSYQQTDRDRPRDKGRQKWTQRHPKSLAQPESIPATRAGHSGNWSGSDPCPGSPAGARASGRGARERCLEQHLPGGATGTGGLFGPYPLDRYTLDQHFSAISVSLTGGVDGSSLPAQRADRRGTVRADLHHARRAPQVG
jgi:hypothetical protein